MLQETSKTFGWKYLLTAILLISANIGHTSVISIGGDISMTANDRIAADIIYPENHTLSPLSSGPITILNSPVEDENSVVYEDAQVVSDDKKIYTGYVNQRIKLKESGLYRATLTDFEFPGRFDMLGLSITSPTEKMGEIWDSGNFDFEATPGKYFLGLVYKTDETLNLGMYGVKLRYVGATSTVPLPASLWLMLTGIMAIVTYKRKS